MGKKISLAEYARHRGVSRAAVTYAAQAGRITVEVDPVTKGKLVDVEVADAQWSSNTNHMRRENALSTPKPQAEEATFAAPPVGEDGKTRSVPLYSESRALREAFMARLAKIDFDVKSARLVKSEEVKAAAFKTARLVRDQMMNIPDRIAAELAAEHDEFKVHQRLTDEIRKALEGVGDDR